MRTEILILSETDITQETKIDRNTGSQTTLGKVRAITTNPTETKEVIIPTELWQNGKAAEVLKRIVGKNTLLDIEHKVMTFADENGKHVKMERFQLYALPQQDK